jgi:hypothetical protein
MYDLCVFSFELEAILLEKKAKTPCTSQFGRLMPPATKRPCSVLFEQQIALGDRREDNRSFTFIDAKQ